MKATMNFNKNLLLGLLLAFSLSLASAFANAQSATPDVVSRANQMSAQAEQKNPTPPTASGGFFANLQATTQQLSGHFNNNILSTLADAGLRHAAHFITPALSLAGGLALIYLLYESIMFLGAKNGSMLTVLFDVGIPAATAALLITNYSNTIGMFDREILSLLREVAGEPTARVMKFYGSVMQMISDAILTSFKSFSVADLLSVNVQKMAQAALDAIMTILFALVILIIVFSSLAEVIGLLLLGPFLYAIALAFGPFMLAGMVTPWTREYVGKWLGFLIGSAVLTGVLSLIISISITVFEQFEFSKYVEGRSTAMQLGMVAVMLMAVNSLIAQAPSIASALIPGAIGAKTGGGQQTTKSAQKAGQTAGKAAAAWTGRKGANVAKAAASKPLAALKAAYLKHRP